MSAMDDASPHDTVPLPDSGSPSAEPTAATSHDDPREAGPGPARLGVVTPRAPEETGAWLHVVSGASVPTLSRAVFELAARFLARGHRVLLVDGAPKLRLHQRFDRESRWGVVECLGDGLPVLGLVQDSGRLGLYLLAHGTPAGPTAWPGIGRMLDEVRPYFGRAILALDPEAPEAIGEALAGVHLEGWWPQGASEARRATGIGGRLAIPFTELSLDAMLTPTLEALDDRLWTLVAPAPPAEPAPEPAPEPAAESAAESAAAADASEPVTLEGDPQ
ncbi:MAG: hypothetical protein ACRENJ_02105, partial [Candidatus Eiseniibacteriota bacterium]